MCRNRRALVQKVSMAGQEPKTTYSLNPSALQFWATLFTCAALIFGGMKILVAYEFNKALSEFHMVAKPEIREMIVEEVADHAIAPAHGSVMERLRQREAHDAATDVRLKAMEDMIKETNRMVKEIYRNGNTHE